MDELSLARERLSPLTAEQSALLERYHAAKRERNLADYTDLLEHWLARLQAEPERQWSDVLVDEIQDLSPLQVALVRALMPEGGHGFFGIGDPDQPFTGSVGRIPMSSPPCVKRGLRWRASRSPRATFRRRNPDLGFGAAWAVLSLWKTYPHP